MRNHILVFTASFMLLAAANAQTSLNTIEIAGSACDGAVGTRELLQVSPMRYQIPNGIYLKKDEDKRVARGVCTFALNLQASTQTKIVVSNSHQLVSVRTYPAQTKARVELEIFKAGTQGDKQILEIASVDKAEKLSQVMSNQSLELQTECGGSMILRGNLAATLTGEGKARAFTRPLYLDISEVPCH